VREKGRRSLQEMRAGGTSHNDTKLTVYAVGESKVRKKKGGQRSDASAGTIGCPRQQLRAIGSWESGKEPV